MSILYITGSVSSSPAVVDLTVDLTSPLGRITPPLRRTTPPLNEIVDLTDPSNESSSVVFLDSGKIYVHITYYI